MYFLKKFKTFLKDFPKMHIHTFDLFLTSKDSFQKKKRSLLKIIPLAVVTGMTDLLVVGLVSRVFALLSRKRAALRYLLQFIFIRPIYKINNSYICFCFTYMVSIFFKIVVKRVSRKIKSKNFYRII